MGHANGKRYGNHTLCSQWEFLPLIARSILKKQPSAYQFLKEDDESFFLTEFQAYHMGTGKVMGLYDMLAAGISIFDGSVNIKGVPERISIPERGR